MSDTGSEKFEVFKPRRCNDKDADKKSATADLSNAFNNNAFDAGDDSNVNAKNGKDNTSISTSSSLSDKVEVATEVKETIIPGRGHTALNNNTDKRQQNSLMNNNNSNKLVVEQDERLLPQQQQKYKHHRNKSEGSSSNIQRLNNDKKTATAKNGTVVSVPVIETIFTDTENTGTIVNNKTARMNGHSGGMHHNHTTALNGGLMTVLNNNHNKNHTAFKKISSPPMPRKFNGNGTVPTAEHGMNLPVEEVESPDMNRRRKYSNNHLYVPHNGAC